MAYKTPGVYIKEVPLFPPSVAQVETAIPAFVGYTETAADSNGKSLLNVPVRIKSLVEFQSLFGSGYIPESYTVVADKTKGNSLVKITLEKQFYLFDAMRQFYDNGGGACYVVSVGSFSETINYESLSKGYGLLRKFDEPTLLLSPDAVGLKDADKNPDLAQFSELQKSALKQCADLQDRFCILDILEGYLPEDVSNKPISHFRDNTGINFLNYGAAYYPWIITSYKYDVSFRQLQINALHLFDSSDGLTNITDFTSYPTSATGTALKAALAARQEDVNASSGISIPGIDKTALLENGIDYLKGLIAGYHKNLEDDVDKEKNISDYLDLLAGIAGCFKKAEDQAADGSNLETDIAGLKANATLTDAIVFLIKIEKNPTTTANTLNTRTDIIVKNLYAPLESGWLVGTTYDLIVADPTTIFPNSNIGCQAIMTALSAAQDELLNEYKILLDAALLYESEAKTDIINSTSFSKDKGEQELMKTLAARQKETDEVTNISIPDIDKATLRNRGTGYLKELFDGYEADLGTNFVNYLNLMASIAGCFKNADTLASSDSSIKKDINGLKATKDLTKAIAFLVGIEKNTSVMAYTMRDASGVKVLYEKLEKDWFGGSTYISIPTEGTDFSLPAGHARQGIVAKLSDSLTEILKGYQSLLDAALFYERQAENVVFTTHSFFRGVKDKLIEHMRTLPPSGSIAGVYAATDRIRGVWKAPANISINSIIGPSVKIDNQDQDELNIHSTGKSVNAIRSFTGKGTLVWGSRTLAGNDNEWRYVPVRRFFIMVEESTKKASEPFVFEPNDANTWVKVRAMMENFLVLQWRAGALQGAKPEDAFFVRVGLNETMTELDILEGRMNVEIGLAVVRPAEFIILRFSHKMLSSKG